MTNFGVHYIDFIHWALGFDYPLAVAAMGGKFVIDDNREIPDTLEVIWQYPNNTLVTLSQFNATAAPPAARPAEIEFRGTKGTLYVQSSGYEVVPDTVTPNEFPPRNPANRELEKGYYKGAAPMIEAQKKTGASAGNTAFHARNFLDCVRSRQKPVCDILTGHRSTSATLIANIAHQTRALLEWDGKRERFTNHPTANDKLSYMYRPPYRLPG